ncbi:MAG: hypothetical protein PHG04_03485 [Candidatus Nanoarchaeia archaeon]|nr:hypothetical protein [Candidatus Nanoarchaeia archaeon]MDD5054411.1 hypothetical protein [Candidatus Nanoarchaeia archaeon]
MDFPLKYVMIIVGFVLVVLVAMTILLGFEEAMRFMGLDRIDFIMRLFKYQ